MTSAKFSNFLTPPLSSISRNLPYLCFLAASAFGVPPPCADIICTCLLPPKTSFSRCSPTWVLSLLTFFKPLPYIAQCNQWETLSHDIARFFWDLYTSGKIWGRVLKMSQPQDQPPPYQSPTAPSDKGCYELQAQTGGQAESPNKIIQMPPAPVLGMDPGSKFSSIWNELLVVQILWNKLSLDCVKLFPLAEEVRGGSNYIELTFLTI